MWVKANVNASFLATCGAVEAEWTGRETELSGMLPEIVDAVKPGSNDTAP